MIYLGQGVIEAFYGPPWSWAARENYANFLSDYDFSFYIFAPKRCEDLRLQWKRKWPKDDWAALSRLRQVYGDRRVKFGVGLSPSAGVQSYDSNFFFCLKKKIRTLNTLDLDLLGIFFDDMPGTPNLVDEQISIVLCIAELSNASNLIVCPTYYSDDPVLTRLSGDPGDYILRLGELLPSSIGVCWTGPQICSKTVTLSHLVEVGRRFGRPVFFWDNYPVNDGVRMSRHLHIGSFTGREELVHAPVLAHAANPMNQPFLSQIPLMTLAELYRCSSDYNSSQAFDNALKRLNNSRLAEALRRDCCLFQKSGLDSLSVEQNTALSRTYTHIEGPISEEICAWLEGKFAPLPADLAEFQSYQTV